ncbi:MAG TPA: hypothetical protein PLH63_03580 [Candidatus Cloacimonadota bacterium]|nr:hypothetical protein [Candidatus Cloacimonadota bacterium]
MRAYIPLVYNNEINRLHSFQLREGVNDLKVNLIDAQNNVIETRILSEKGLDILNRLYPCILDISASKRYIEPCNVLNITTRGTAMLFSKSFVESDGIPEETPRVLSSCWEPIISDGRLSTIVSMHNIVRTTEEDVVLYVKLTLDNYEDPFIYKFNVEQDRFNFLLTSVGIASKFAKLDFYCNKMIEIHESVFHTIKEGVI